MPAEQEREYHLEKWREAPAPDAWLGHNLTCWARDIGAKDAATALPKGRMARDQLVQFLQSEIDIEKRFLAVMAWGGMRRSNGRRAWAQKAKLSNKLLELSSKTNRADAYRLMHQANIPGVGPAYFTKLIFFLCPGISNAYIMDQWTGKSINMLFEPCVHIQSGWVTNRNDATVYEKFCANVDELSDLTGWQGSVVEERLFSQPRPKPEHWRHHVKKYWKSKQHNRLRVGASG